jgi:short-subunit dehydrogenase
MSTTKHTNKKTIAIFGAGPGLGASLATRFGREGHRIALVARGVAALQERVAELARAGIEAVAFPTDLTKLDGVVALVRSIEQRLGSVDVAVYSPVPSGVSFVSAVELDAAKLQSIVSLFMFAPVEVTHAVLPGMLARGDGAVIIINGVTAAVPIPGFSGFGPPMAAVRNYVLTLNPEVLAKGVYAGTVNIGGMIERSAMHRAATAAGAKPNPHFPLINPDDIAQEIWTLIAKRDRAEIFVPPLPSA